MAPTGPVVAPLHLRFGALSADNYPAIDVSPRGGSSVPKTATKMRETASRWGEEGVPTYIWQIAGNCQPFVCKSIQCSPDCSDLRQSSSRVSTGSGKRGAFTPSFRSLPQNCALPRVWLFR